MLDILRFRSSFVLSAPLILYIYRVDIFSPSHKKRRFSSKINHGNFEFIVPQRLEYHTDTIQTVLYSLYTDKTACRLKSRIYLQNRIHFSIKTIKYRISHSSSNLFFDSFDCNCSETQFRLFPYESRRSNRFVLLFDSFLFNKK